MNRSGIKPGTKRMARGKGITRKPARRRATSTSHHKAEFSPAVRLLIRKRAGNGCTEDARCEACLVWLGEHGGQIQHIKARGTGGSRDPELGSPVGGALLCGTNETGCHGLCEARDRGMYAAGYWIKFAEVLGAKPVRVGWRTGTWTPQWLLADGTYGGGPAQRGDGNLAGKNFEARDAA